MRLHGLLLVASLLGAACGRGEDRTSSAVSGGLLDTADQVAFGFRTLVTDGGLLRAEIFADTALFQNQNTKIVLLRVTGDFFGATGAKAATATSQRGTFDTRTSTLEAFGDVVITSVDGRVLRTPYIRYDRSSNQVYSDSSFVLTEPGEREMRGIGFRTDPSLSAIEVLRIRSGKGGTFTLPDDS
ncbi:MAG: LPS export ABC transporter periplasmic protein LptC [Gemmatimonadetes bacterium]|nr:LPS export ABC transporter periplasmic protein LptC [Gemmatimonadota bacterium]MBM4191164.1 LPS export ABC transporter periplasmic protein LptC [Gemmatimonadota bacterium]